MRIYVIHPGADFATHDVYTGVVAGLRAQPGIDLYEGRLDSILTWYELALDAGGAQGVFNLEMLRHGAFNKQRMASAHITQHILQIWPDWVVVVSGHNYHLEDVRALRKVGLKVAILLTEAPYFGSLEALLANVYTTAFTNERKASQHLGAHYLPHAYNPTVHQSGPADPAKVCDAFFVGSWFEERRALLLPLAESGVDLVWKGHDLTNSPTAVLPNEEAAAYYRSARVNLNIHRTTTSAGSGEHIKAGEAESLNPRAYEIAACGGFQLMDDSRAERYDIFGDWAPTYKAGDAADLERQTRYWLQHSDRRDETARAMHEAIQPHHWGNRAGQLLEAL